MSSCTCLVRLPQREHAVGRTVTGYAIYLSAITDHTQFDPACPFHGDNGSMRVVVPVSRASHG